MTISLMRLFLASCFILFLSIMPLPQPLDLFRPLWGLTLVLYLQWSLPQGCSVGFVLLAGLALDALGAGLMGQHACALLITAWIASSNAQRFRLLTIGHQMLGLGIFCLIYQCILLVTGFLLGYHTSLLSNLFPIITTVLFWPWVQLVADRMFLTLSIKSRFSS
ncbi:MAG: rod shape-determining protein MreD [Legionellaceae bacterium]|nr:rod shape-determining protein MreD [Legionellaceae bacterium]